MGTERTRVGIVGAGITTDLLSFSGKLRALLEPVWGLPRPGESVEGYLTRAFGPEVARRLGGPLYAGLYASDPGVVEWSPERLGRVATREFETVTGRSGRTLSVRWLPRAMPAYDGSWDALDGVSTPDGIHLLANYESRAGIPGRVRAAEALTTSLAGDASGGRAP